MSGSSLDGLDVVYCSITLTPSPDFTILFARTYAYTESERTMLAHWSTRRALATEEEDIRFAEIMAGYIQQFIRTHNIVRIDAIASHGHTTYHQPDLGRTQQIGDPHTMARILQVPVIGQFRQADVDAGGQGAPLVPICDAMFFAGYDACLNIGGIANISYQTTSGRIGFDICGANQLLNHFAQKAGVDFDAFGNIAASGTIHQETLFKLNAEPYLRSAPPKSLDNYTVFQTAITTLENAALPVADALATAVGHIAQQIAQVIRNQPDRRPADAYTLLVSGGGAFNAHLISSIEQYAGIHIRIPEENIINYKEALAMALMGVLFLEGKPNCLPSVTGARTAVCGGVLALPTK